MPTEEETTKEKGGRVPEPSIPPAPTPSHQDHIIKTQVVGKGKLTNDTGECGENGALAIAHTIAGLPDLVAASSKRVEERGLELKNPKARVVLEWGKLLAEMENPNVEIPSKTIFRKARRFAAGVDEKEPREHPSKVLKNLLSTLDSIAKEVGLKGISSLLTVTSLPEGSFVHCLPAGGSVAEALSRVARLSKDCDSALLQLTYPGHFYGWQRQTEERAPKTEVPVLWQADGFIARLSGVVLHVPKVLPTIVLEADPTATQSTHCYVLNVLEKTIRIEDDSQVTTVPIDELPGCLVRYSSTYTGGRKNLKVLMRCFPTTLCYVLCRAGADGEVIDDVSQTEIPEEPPQQYAPSRVYVSPTLAVVGLSIVPPVAGVAIVYGRYIRGLIKRYNDALAEATHASLSGNGILLTILYAGGYFVTSGALTIGQLSAFLLYAAYVGISIGGLSGFYSELMRGLGASTRLFQLIDRRPHIPLSGGIRPELLRGELAFRNVSFAYPERSDAPVLDSLELTVPEGSVTAVVGSSGSGKSTLFLLLLRFYDPSSGSIMVDGQPLSSLDPEWLRSHVGLVSQEPTLFSSSIADNIAYGAGERAVERDRVIWAAEQAHAMEFIRRFPQGLDTLVGEKGLMLSGGQRQRIAIARALLQEPRLLLLDEATSALDAESEAQVRIALEDLLNDRRRTILLIAHRLSTVRNADQIAVLEAGRVAELGSYSQLMARPDGRFAGLVQKQTLAS